MNDNEEKETIKILLTNIAILSNEISCIAKESGRGDKEKFTIIKALETAMKQDIVSLSVYF